jgi:hypothetical protein
MQRDDAWIVSVGKGQSVMLEIFPRRSVDAEFGGGFFVK